MTDLLPCPFCGSSTPTCYGCQICCEKCGAGTMVEDTKEQAITAWNRRTPDPSLAARVDRQPSDCADCGRPYDKSFDVVIPNEAWARIAPKDGEGILCACCMHDRLVAAGITSAPGVITGGPMAAPERTYSQEDLDYVATEWAGRVAEAERLAALAMQEAAAVAVKELRGWGGHPHPGLAEHLACEIRALPIGGAR